MNNEENNNVFPGNLKPSQEQPSNANAFGPSPAPEQMPNLNQNVTPEQMPNVNPAPQPTLTPNVNPAPQPTLAPNVNPNETVETLNEVTSEPVFKAQEVTPSTDPLAPVETLKEVEPTSNDAMQLEKKVVVEEPVKKDKKGNPLVGFIALLVVLAVIIVAGYYFATEGIINVPGINPKTTTPPVTEPVTEEVTTEEVTTVDVTKIAGLYRQTENTVCPDQAVSLVLGEDNTFTLNDLSFNEAENLCVVSEKRGTYEETEELLVLTQDNGEVVNLNVTQTETGKVLTIVAEEHTVEFNKVS